jgi:hypothetical protein
VQEIQDRATNQEDYLRVTEARMEREKQLRVETARRRRAQRNRKKKMALKEENQRQRKLKERQQKKSEYVNYVRKHLTKVILHPNVHRTKNTRRSKRSRQQTTTSATIRPSSVTSHNPSRTRTQRVPNTQQRQIASHQNTIERPGAGVVEFTRIPLCNDLQGTVKGAMVSKLSKGSDAGQLLKDLRKQMKKNEKLRCSIEALDLQVQIHKSKAHVPAAAAAAASTQMLSHKSLQIDEVKVPENIQIKIVEVQDSSDDENVEVPEVIEEAIVGEYEDDSMDEDICVAGSNNAQQRHTSCNKENMANSPSTSSSTLSTSPLCSPARQKKRRLPPPQAPPQSPTNGDHRAHAKSPTWLRNLDPAPTKIFDSLDLSMSIRQSIEIDRNRQRNHVEPQIVDMDPRAWTPKHEHRKAVIPEMSPTEELSEAGQHATEQQAADQVSVGVVAPLSPPALRRLSVHDMKEHDSVQQQQFQFQQQEHPPAPSTPKANALTPDAKGTGSLPSPLAPAPSEDGYLAMRRKAMDRKKQMEHQREHKKKQLRTKPQFNSILEEESTMRLQQRSSWGRDLSNLTPRRRARREAALRRKEYEQMINLQMKEDRLQRRRLLQKKREKRLEDESRMLQDIQMQQQQQQQRSYYNSEYDHNVTATQYSPPAQFQDPTWQVVPLPNGHSSSVPQQPIQHRSPRPLPLNPSSSHLHQHHHHQDSPQRTLGRDFHNRRLGDIDPRSTISLEEDRLRGSLMRLEQRLDQTRRKQSGGGRGSGANSKGGGGVRRRTTKNSQMKGGPFMMAILPPAAPNGPGNRYDDSNPSRQQQFITEEQHSHGILRYPVAQRTTASRAAGRYNNNNNPTMRREQQPQQPQQPQQMSAMSHAQNSSMYHVQPPTEVQVVPGNNEVPTEVRLSYSVMPRVTTAPSGSVAGGGGYQGLQTTREVRHHHRMASLTNRAQSALPSVRTTTMRVMSSTRKQPKGSLSQKPRTRRIKLGKNKNKVRTGGMSGQVHVNTGKLHLLVSP